MSKRRFLSAEEIELVINAAAKRTTGERDQCLILIAFIHGYRISELLSLKFSDIDFKSQNIYIRRSKNGFSTIHPMLNRELVLLLEWLKVRLTYKNSQQCPYIFMSIRGGVLSRKQAYNIVKSAGKESGIGIETYPHMLRHACGYALADRGVNTRLIQDYLGHRNIRHTVRYTASNSKRFKNIWSNVNHD